MRDLNTRINELENASRVLGLQSQVLEHMARGASGSETLDELCRFIAEMVPDSVPSVMLLDATSPEPCLQMVASAGMPETACATFDGLQPGPNSASCGTAVFTGEPAVVEDTANDPRWAEFREVAKRFGIGACWSFPIQVGDETIGSFAISHFETRSPTPLQRELLATAGFLAGLAVERERSREELQRAEERVRQLQKFESLGVMAGGIAHDFNNLLTGVLGNAELARDLIDAGESAGERIDAISTAARSCAALCSQMLTFAGQTPLRWESSDLTAITREAIELMRTVVLGKAELALHLHPEPTPIVADTGHVSQVVVNLLVNAADAIDGDRGQIEVRTGSRFFDGRDLEGAYLGEFAASGYYAFVEVIDDGHGMSNDVRSRMFDPFYTTRFDGRGLGLASVLGVVRAHGGVIQVESREGVGSTFRVLFPASTEPAAEQKGALPGDDREAPAVDRRALVVDDESLVRDLVASGLRKDGFEIVMASDGSEALAALADGEFDLVFLDRTMPGLSGLQVLEEIRGRDRELPVILSTGHVHSDLPATVVRDDATLLLPKPFGPRELRETAAKAVEVASR